MLTFVILPFLIVRDLHNIALSPYMCHFYVIWVICALIYQKHPFVDQKMITFFVTYAIYK